MSHTFDRRSAPQRLASAQLPDTISRLLARADLSIEPYQRSIAFAPELAEPFEVDRDGHIRVGSVCLARGERSAVMLRHALELAFLLPRLPKAPCLAGLAAARTASLFAAMLGVAEDTWQHAFAAPRMPDHEQVLACWTRLARLQSPSPALPDAGCLARLHACWSLLGPTEALLQSGGDQRLRIDPATGLNFYGCSHRPRPWAVTFASSTASSSSERGFASAEAARQRVTLAALSGRADDGLAEEAAGIRGDIAAHCGTLPNGVVLAASGTDCELLALVLGVGADHRPVVNLLIAPEETGSGVPLAASGCHFASDTARGIAVTKGEPIAGFARRISLARVAARAPDGTMRPMTEIDADCVRMTAAAVAAGSHVILHVLDISKTGYLAQSIETAAAIAARHGDAVSVVVDACQGRLSRARIADYYHRGWIVLLTGSKFLTGPPFAGAVLVPPEHAAAFEAPLPAGIADYSSRPEWPSCTAAAGLPRRANYGLLLRWRAALAEWDAFDLVAPEHRHEILVRFCIRVRQGIAANPDVALFETPAPARTDDDWDSLQTIIGFVVRPDAPLDPVEARSLYNWLNADLRPALPPSLTAEQERLACLRCHIGQPVPLPGPGGRMIGVLRISAGARLVSGEPSHHDLDEDARLLREIRDALSVLAKISLILAHWDALEAADPQPSF